MGVLSNSKVSVLKTNDINDPVAAETQGPL